MQSTRYWIRNDTLIRMMRRNLATWHIHTHKMLLAAPENPIATMLHGALLLQNHCQRCRAFIGIESYGNWDKGNYETRKLCCEQNLTHSLIR